MGWQNRCDVGELNGKHLVKVVGLVDGEDDVIFECSNGDRYKMFHEQDCCESVYLADIVGDVADLQDADVVYARQDDGEAEPLNEHEESYTWTFYRIQTNKGCVVLRWYGSSNGYYSESVNFERI